MSRLPLIPALSLLALGVPLGGCDFLDPPGTTVLKVFTTHHASPGEGGVVPPSPSTTYRVFDSDQGWSVTLTAAYVTTAQITLLNCAQEMAQLQLYRGLVAESLTTTDYEDVRVGWIELPKSQLCGVLIHHAPFDPAQSEMDVDPAVAGATIYLKGLATRAGQDVPFEVVATDPIDISLDFSHDPLRISGEEAFDVDLLVTKTYDRFFDGIDFATATAEDLEQHVLAILEQETSIRKK